MSGAVDREITAYFSSLSFSSRKIAKEENGLMSYFGNRWDSLTQENKDELMDDWFVSKDVRKKYEEAAQQDIEEYPSSFPRLMIPSGEKIMVDETDLRTWRDAHSGPFSWKSKSQQDLSLDDFEPDVISKPPLKGKRAKGGITNETDSNEQDSVAPLEFIYNDEPWTDAMLAEFRNHLDTEVVRSRSTSPLEAVNEAFEGSTKNLTCSQSQSNIVSEVSSQNTESRDIGETPQNESSQASEKSKPLKSPKKMSKSRSFSKNENSDTTQKLIKDQENEQSKQAFCNPGMVTEWSTFVGQESHPKQPVVNEPPVLMMDRGEVCENNSTDTSPDHASHLIASEHSIKPSPDHTSHLIASEHSIKPSPDHTSHLIASDQSRESSPETSPDHTTLLLPNQTAEEEKDEVLTVIVSNTESESDIPRTGFDFLDNW